MNGLPARPLHFEPQAPKAARWAQPGLLEQAAEKTAPLPAADPSRTAVAIASGRPPPPRQPSGRSRWRRPPTLPVKPEAPPAVPVGFVALRSRKTPQPWVSVSRVQAGQVPEQAREPRNSNPPEARRRPPGQPQPPGRRLDSDARRTSGRDRIRRGLCARARDARSRAPDRVTTGARSLRSAAAPASRPDPRPAAGRTLPRSQTSGSRPRRAADPARPASVPPPAGRRFPGPARQPRARTASGWTPKRRRESAKRVNRAATRMPSTDS